MDIRLTRILSSIPTNSIDEGTKLPQSTGSGCFIKYKDFILFLTVYHTLKNYSLNTGIVVDFKENSGVKLLPLNIVPPIIKGKIGVSKFGTLDFSCIRFNEMPECYFFDVDAFGKIQSKVKRLCIETDLEDIPTESEDYGFAGFVYGHLSGNPYSNSKFEHILNQELAYYSGLKYKGMSDDFHVFTLPNCDYEHADFYGTSGAPILDNSGRLVSLVACGGPSENNNEWIIKGINLAKYKDIIDVECGLL